MGGLKLCGSVSWRNGAQVLLKVWYEDFIGKGVAEIEDAADNDGYADYYRWRELIRFWGILFILLDKKFFKNWQAYTSEVNLDLYDEHVPEERITVSKIDLDLSAKSTYTWVYTVIINLTDHRNVAQSWCCHQVAILPTKWQVL